jgi:ribosomal protein S2
MPVKIKPLNNIKPNIQFLKTIAESIKNSPEARKSGIPIFAIENKNQKLKTVAYFLLFQKFLKYL